MDVRKQDAATFVRRFLRHPEFDTSVKRMGAVIRVAPQGLTVWRLHATNETHMDWMTLH